MKQQFALYEAQTLENLLKNASSRVVFLLFVIPTSRKSEIYANF